MISSPASAAWAAAQTVMTAIRLSNPAIEEWEKRQPVPVTFAVITWDAVDRLGDHAKALARRTGPDLKLHELLRMLALAVIHEHRLPMVAEPDGVLCLVPSY